MTEQINAWSIQRTIPLTFILAFVLQTAGLIWAASTHSSDIQQNRRDIDALELQVTSLQNIMQQQAVSLARIDESHEIRDVNLLCKVLDV